MEIFLVGGAVRDKLLGKSKHDFDFVVIGAGESEFWQKFPQAIKVGKNKPLFYVGQNEYTLSPCASIEQDLEQRDLTINALAEDRQGRLFAHPLALADLKTKILRPVRAQNFWQDPVRVFRAARFWAELPDFSLHSELIEVCKQVVAKSEKWRLISPERVSKEFLKALAGPRPGNFLRFLNLIGGFGFWFAELAHADQIPAGPFPYHKSSVLGHTCRLMDQVGGDTLAVWMAFAHDLGKVKTPAEILPHHYGHEKRGVELVKTLASRIRLPKLYQKAGQIAARYHMQAGNYHRLRPGTKVKLLLKVEPYLESFFKMIRADSNRDFLAQAQKDLDLIKSVSLPEKFRGLGSQSGQILFSLRAAILKNKQ